MDIVSSGSQTYRLASLLPSLWHPGGPWDDPGDLGVQAWIFIDFRLIWGIHFDSFSGLLDQKKHFVHACVQVTFSNDSGF